MKTIHFNMLQAFAFQQQMLKRFKSTKYECYDCGSIAKIPGSDGNHYCDKCWYGEDRKVLVARYSTEDVFIIPDSIDLEDTSVVKEYYVKWGSLNIEFVDGRKWKIASYIESCDHKIPDETTIESIKNWYIGDMVGCDNCGEFEIEEDITRKDGKNVCSRCC